jgi:predicted small lipoprotein YifL
MKRFWCLLLVLLLACSMAACSAKAPAETTEDPAQAADASRIDYSGQQTAKPNPDDTFAATYQIVRIETVSGEGSADEATMQDIRDRGYRTLLVLQEDGTGVMDLRGELTPFVYDDDSGVITMNDQTSQMILSEDGSLVITDKAGTMYLELMD